jgi:hypothetical protein
MRHLVVYFFVILLPQPLLGPDTLMKAVFANMLSDRLRIRMSCNFLKDYQISGKEPASIFRIKVTNQVSLQRW